MMQTKLFPWYMAQVRKVAVTNATLAIRWWEAYWTAWSDVMFPEAKGCRK